MARTYGGRWQILSSLNSGGQADVFKIRDLRGEYPDELVLKRVRNPKRHDRFRAEVEAIKRLNHPNIIRLIDHSALVNNGEVPDLQFIVMPYANQGDLSSRAALYANNPDSVVQVAKSLALALQAAHAAKIVHRDVKPQNVLFPTITHDVWLSDFGICLIRDRDRETPADEVVGPVQFMAPELEGGGQLEVSPAADVYSLGKIIYYMLSGGIVLPRERLHDPEYAKVFRVGERQRLFEMLLSRMICSLPNRFPSMEEVLVQLDRIESWERDAKLLPIQPKTMSAIEAMKRRALEVRQQTEMNVDIRNRRNATLDTTTKGALDWFQAELEKTAALIQDGHAISAGVRLVAEEKNDSPSIPHLNYSYHRPGAAVDLWVQNKYEAFQREHMLRFSICSKVAITFSGRIITGSEPSVQIPPQEPEHVELLLLPSYGRKLQGDRPNQQADWQLFSHDGRVYRLPDNRNQSRQTHMRRGDGVAQPQQPLKIKAIPFSTVDWPSIASAFPAFIEQTVDAFISAVNMDPGSLR